MPNDTDNKVEQLLKSLDAEVVLNNIAVTYKEILYLSSLIIVIAFAAYFV